jgi:protein ImuA
MSRAEVIRELQERLRSLERSHHAVGKATWSTGIAPLDRLLPSGTLRSGTLIEWLADAEGAGAATLALLSAVHLLRETTGVLVVVDPPGEFYPPAAAQLGVPLDRLVVVRPRGVKETLWTIEQSLRSRGAMVVFANLGPLDGRVFRRLQLAAETGGGIGYLMRPVACRGEPTWAESRLLVEGLPTPARSGRRLKVTSLRGQDANGTVELEVCDETGDVRLAPRLAVAKTSARSARA